jgi:NAD(P)-dependent dehydrogenase (short-subunit alcohol dehydrogenase family)
MSQSVAKDLAEDGGRVRDTDYRLLMAVGQWAMDNAQSAILLLPPAVSGFPVYTTSKAAIHGLTRGMARVLGGHDQGEDREDTRLAGM